jgi:hypothetical protein
VDDNDLGKFEKIFRRAYLAAQVRWKAEDYAERLGMYFRRLRCAPVDDVAKAAATWFDSNKKFPAIADWLALLGHPQLDHELPSGERVMGITEQAEWDAAMKVICQRAPCTCLACQAAGVDTRDQRFVPVEDRDGYVKAWHSRKKELVVVGEWIHGEALKHWYAAKQACADDVEAMPPQIRGALKTIVPFEHRANAIFRASKPKPTTVETPDDAQRQRERLEIEAYKQRYGHGREPGEDDE